MKYNQTPCLSVLGFGEWMLQLGKAEVTEILGKCKPLLVFWSLPLVIVL